MMKMVAHCRVEETTYAWVGDDCFEVTKPDVVVEVSGGDVVVLLVVVKGGSESF